MDHSMKTITEYFEGDHDRLDGLFREFQTRKTTEFVTARDIFIQFKTGLERHILWEEEILFPIFEEKTGMREVGPTAVMRLEHQMIKNVLDVIYQKLQNNNPDTGAEEAALVSHLMQHNQKEENILYPQIDRLVNARERSIILEKINETLL